MNRTSGSGNRYRDPTPAHSGLFRPSLVTLRSEPHGCTVSFSTESVSIHTVCFPRPGLFTYHDNTMQPGRGALGITVADLLVSHRMYVCEAGVCREDCQG